MELESKGLTEERNCIVQNTEKVCEIAENLHQPPETTKTISVINSCRLCLQEQEKMRVDIFAKAPNEDEMESKSLAERLNDLLHVKYEYQKPLPQNICEQCLFMVETFTKFRDKVQQCENLLQNRFKELKQKYSDLDLIPGLNGVPGEFVIDDSIEITEVNIEQEYESSEDDFSMESESETEETTSNQQPAIRNENGEVLKSSIMNTSSLTATSTNMDTEVLPAINESTSKTVCYLCQFCDMAFTAQPNCVEHERTMHDLQMPYICHFCQARHTSRQAVIAHIRQHHQPDRPYVCTLCSKGFCRRSDLKKHTIVHTGVRPYTCSVCTKSFSRNTNLTKHMRIHNGMKPHVCQLCPRSFGTAQELLLHARTHTDVKPYKCDQCPASYSRRDKLHIHKLTHLRRHTEHDFMQMQTNILDAPLLQQQQQQQHTTIEQRPYEEQLQMQHALVTEQTDNNITQHNSILAAHLMQQQHQQQQQMPMQRVAQTKQRVFSCDICVKTFPREQDLQRHQALHLDDLFACKICNITFSRREKLLRHMQDQHNPPTDGLNLHTKHAALNASPTKGGNMEFMQQAEMSFYAQMVPTMSLGFYNETRPES